MPALQFVTRISPARDLSVTTHDAYAVSLAVQGHPHTHLPFADSGTKIPTLGRLAADHAPNVIGGHACTACSGTGQHPREIRALFGDTEGRSTCDCIPRLRRTVGAWSLQHKHYVRASDAGVGLQKGKNAAEQVSFPRAKAFAFPLHGIEVALDTAGKAQFLKRDRIGTRHTADRSIIRTAFPSAGFPACAECDGMST